jgi:hypothetical protein
MTPLIGPFRSWQADAFKIVIEKPSLHVEDKHRGLGRL